MNSLGNLLIVDDDIDICNLMVYYLKELDLTIQVVHSGQEALESLKLSSFDLVISDILMPGINGIELTKKIVDQYPGIKILVCSEGGTTDAKEIVASIVLSKAVEYGALQAIKKPFSRREFVSTVNNAISGQSIQEEEEIS